MATVEATCPKCHQTNWYGEELVGRYTLCHNCSCRFYVEVPRLGASVNAAHVSKPRMATTSPQETTTLDNLLWDTQQGSNLVIQSLRRQEQRLGQIAAWLVVVAVLLVINLLVSIF